MIKTYLDEFDHEHEDHEFNIEARIDVSTEIYGEDADGHRGEKRIETNVELTIKSIGREVHREHIEEFFPGLYEELEEKTVERALEKLSSKDGVCQ